MKMKFFLAVCLLSLFLGCEKNSQSTFQGVEEKRDYMAQGMQYLAQKDIKHAILSFDQAIKQDPTNAANYLTLGEIYLKLKNYKAAIDTFSGASRIDPSNGDAYYFMGLAKVLQSKAPVPDALKDIEKSIDLYVQKKDEQKFKRSVNLLKELTAKTKIPLKTQAQTLPSIEVGTKPAG